MKTKEYWHPKRGIGEPSLEDSDCVICYTPVLRDPKDRPEDNQTVIYLFEPFNSWYIGRYDKEYDSVGGPCGFTTWLPEVLAWYPNKR